MSSEVLKYTNGGPGTPFLRYIALVKQCVAIRTAKMYFSNPGAMPSLAHLKHKSAANISFLRLLD